MVGVNLLILSKHSALRPRYFILTLPPELWLLPYILPLHPGVSLSIPYDISFYVYAHTDVDIYGENYRQEELASLKRKEYELAHKSSYLEVEYGKLMEQLGKSRETIEMLNSEIRKLNGEVELQKTRAANTKEKLNLLVTEGKPLVQQRDSLKQVIVEKTNKLDKCLIELQEKSTALEAADSLKEALLQRDVNYLAEDRLELDKCSNKIENLSEEHILKDQNGSLQVDLQRYEDKAALLREKLFMVVKKDNGLYFTGRVIEATDEIAIPIDVIDPVEKAKWCATYLNECQLEIVKVERVGDLKDKAVDVTKLVEKRMIVATDEVVIPANVTEPLEKVMWCATYIHECQVAKAKKNYEKKWEEVSTHAINLNEARKSIKSLEDATSQLQTHVSQLSNVNSKRG
ncbi:hypothetical protein Tco_0636766 [Tanacetum coccineum]